MPTKTKKSTKPRTHKFHKVIVTEGKYNQYNQLTGKYDLVKEVTQEDLKKTLETANKMQAKGLKIPAPWKHDFDITTFTKVQEGTQGLLEDSTKNAGFWDNLTLDFNDEGKLELSGDVEVPGDPDNADTPAGKVGTQVKETSIYLRDKYPLTDGSGEVLEKALMHIALVTHPIEGNQTNFELMEENDSFIAMSQLLPEDTKDSSNASISELIKELRDSCKLFVPPNTTVDTLVSNLLIAVGQYKLMSCDEDGDEDSDPAKSKTSVEPLIMSKLSEAAVNKLLSQVNPDTNKPYTKEELGLGVVATVATDPKQDLIMSAMQTQMESDRRVQYRNKIDTLVENGQTTKAFADSNLYPQADAYCLQFEGSKVVTPALESIIMSLSQQEIRNKKVENGSIVMAGAGIEDFDNVAEADMDSLAESMASML
jgi:hypothetical protein